MHPERPVTKCKRCKTLSQAIFPLRTAERCQELSQGYAFFAYPWKEYAINIRNPNGLRGGAAG
jgi:hypothetical protein